MREVNLNFKRNFILLTAAIILFSCKWDNTLESEIANIEVPYKMERFDSLFSKAKEGDLPKLKADYPFMLSSKYKDSFWISKIKDTLQQQLSKEVELNLGNLSDVKMEITQLFQHLKYYFPQFRTPRVVTAVSYVDYRNKTFVTDTIVLIHIDNYLGSNHEFYQGISQYIREDFEEEQIVVDLATNYASKYIFSESRRTLLDEMIFYGKELYFKDKIIPFKTDAQKIGYTQEELEWAQANEFQIWQYFIDREMLYSTDSKLPGRFINPAPFSKFQLEQIDNDSPGSIGKYIGWQIVRAYMNNNDVSFKDMLSKSTEEIFNKSNFKPRKD